MVPHSILVGVDGSEAAADAVRWAVGLLREGDTLCLVTVMSCSQASDSSTASQPRSKKTL
jgi:nucleotide-binding universal stress UspA family protein